MIDLIKLDLKNVWKKTKVFNMVAIFILILSIIVPKDLLKIFFMGSKANDIFNIMVPVISSVTIGIYVIAISMFLIFRMSREVGEDNYNLLMLSTKKPWQIIVSKLITNAICVLFVMLISTVFANFIIKFNTVTTEFHISTIDTLENTLGILSMGITIYFAYIFSKSFKITRKNPVLSTILILFVILIVNFIIDLIFLKVCGAQINFTSYPFGVSINEDFINNQLYSVCTYLQDALWIVFGTYFSIKLFDKKLEK